MKRAPRPHSNLVCKAMRHRDSRIGSMVATMSATLLILLAVDLHHEAWAEIRIRQSSVTGQVHVHSNERSFARGFRLKIKVDRETITGKQFGKYIRSLRLRTENGRPIESFDYTAEEDLIVGTSRQTGININHVERTAKGKHIFISSRNDRGDFSKLRKDDIGVFGTDGVSQCFDVRDVEDVDTIMLFDILVDRSGSMSYFIPAVREAVTRFMAHLPSYARCRVTSFNDSYKRHTPNHRLCVAGTHGLDGLIGTGGTDIFGALAAVYDDQQPTREAQRAVVVVTDGVGNSNIAKEVLQQKKNAVTFVYWLGEYDQSHLAGLADEYIYGRDDVRTTLNRYFESIGSAVREQQVIVTRRDCSVGKRLSADQADQG